MVLVCWNDLILQGYGSCPPDTLVLHASPGTRHYLTSPNYPEPYPNGITCMWEMRAPSSDHRVHIEITDFRLEVCPFDAIAIHDGTSSESRRLLRVCGDENPVHVTSTGQSLFIMFETDAFVQEKGFEITYTSFVVGEQCPPSWNYFENNCYKIRNETLTWDDAQKHCTYDASNLVVIDNEDENSFIGLISSVGMIDNLVSIAIAETFAPS
uniref:Cubilin-like n=1 Tax=Saccoglossus kowalevskii TaxID=10224 RepID=A0ABM0MN86_SACKO|nr:PREDICTED: cubilin-like [Saccoglossus kowalevskii]